MRWGGKKEEPLLFLIGKVDPNESVLLLQRGRRRRKPTGSLFPFSSSFFLEANFLSDMMRRKRDKKGKKSTLLFLRGKGPYVSPPPNGKKSTHFALRSAISFCGKGKRRRRSFSFHLFFATTTLPCVCLPLCLH